MPMTIEGVIAMQACARIGATHSVVFGGFSAKALQERIIDAGAVAVITANFQMRGGKELPLKAIVDDGIALGGCDIDQDRAGLPAHARPPATWSPAATRPSTKRCKGQGTECPPEPVGAEHPLFILYTSGSTGKPKGVQHATGGYLLWAKLTMDWTFDIRPEDVFWCTADIGWITGHTYVAYGPLAAGATQVVFEGIPTFPHAGRFWQMIEKHKVTVFYTAPTAIRSLIKAADSDEKVHPEELGPVLAAHPRHGGRADQSRSLDVVPPERRRREVPDRRHLLADRDRRPRDHAAAGRHAAGAGLLHAAAAGHHGRDRRRDRQGHARTAPAACW